MAASLFARVKSGSAFEEPERCMVERLPHFLDASGLLQQIRGRSGDNGRSLPVLERVQKNPESENALQILVLSHFGRFAPTFGA